MMSRLTACCLALLTLAPVTAPFRVVDLAALLHGAHAHAAVKAPSSSTSTNEIALANVPTMSRVGRVRVSPLSGISAPRATAVVASTGVAMAASPDDGRRRGAELSTILRL